MLSGCAVAILREGIYYLQCGAMQTKQDCFHAWRSLHVVSLHVARVGCTQLFLHLLYASGRLWFKNRYWILCRSASAATIRTFEHTPSAPCNKIIIHSSKCEYWFMQSPCSLQAKSMYALLSQFHILFIKKAITMVTYTSQVTTTVCKSFKCIATRTKCWSISI